MGKNIYFIAIVSLLFVSCRDIFESDLSQETETLIVPANGTIQTNTNVTFMWDEVEGATEYQIQIATPDFATATAYVYDSTVENMDVTFELSPGNFEWRVRGLNYSSATIYSDEWSLTIDSSYDLTSQGIVLYTPSDLIYTNATSLSFTWQDLYAADSYNFILKSGDWSTGVEVENTTASTNGYSSVYGFTEGIYSWSVRGENSLPSYTVYAPEYNIYIDQTNPATPIGLLPDSFTTGLEADSSYLFEWTRPTDPGTVNSSLFDSIYVFSDTNQLPISTFYSSIEDTTFVLPSTVGTYFWRVATFDVAGNVSTISNTNSFTVQ